MEEAADILEEAKNVFICLCTEFKLEDYKLPVSKFYSSEGSQFLKYTSFKFIQNPEKIRELVKDKDPTTDTIEAQEFINWYTKNAINELLYQKTIEEQKNYTKDLTKLYYALGGDSNGISKDKIKKYLREYFKENNDNSVDPDNECKEIMDFLAGEKDVLTLSDFINVMTSSIAQG